MLIIQWLLTTTIVFPTFFLLVSCGELLPSTKSITIRNEANFTFEWTITPKYGEAPDWLSLFYQEKPNSPIVPIWCDSNGVLDYGNSKFNGSMAVQRPSTNRLKATFPNIGESMWIYMTVVFKDNSRAIVNGPIFSKCEIKHFSITSVFQIQGGKQIYGVSKFSNKSWKISFYIKPFGYVHGWGSILHATSHGDGAIYGDRNPGIWFWPGTRLHICSAVIPPGIPMMQIYTCYDDKFQLPKNKFSGVIIQQLLIGKEYRYRITINDELVYDVVNTRPTSFTNVKYYAGDPWYTPANAVIGNLKLNDKFLV